MRRSGCAVMNIGSARIILSNYFIGVSTPFLNILTSASEKTIPLSITCRLPRTPSKFLIFFSSRAISEARGFDDDFAFSHPSMIPHAPRGGNLCSVNVQLICSCSTSIKTWPGDKPDFRGPPAFSCLLVIKRNRIYLYNGSGTPFLMICA